MCSVELSRRGGAACVEGTYDLASGQRVGKNNPNLVGPFIRCEPFNFKCLLMFQNSQFKAHLCRIHYYMYKQTPNYEISNFRIIILCLDIVGLYWLIYRCPYQ